MVVTTPWHLSKEGAKALVAQKEEWICQQLTHHTHYGRNNPLDYSPSASIWLLGQQYPVMYQPAGRSRIDFRDDHFLFQTDNLSKFSQALERFYRRYASELLPKRVAWWSEQMQLTPKGLKFRHYKSRWGCCSHDNVITLNTALLRYDMELIDYVIVHELAHIRYKHHQKPFWKLVEQFMPEWRILRKRLV